MFCLFINVSIHVIVNIARRDVIPLLIAISSFAAYYIVVDLDLLFYSIDFTILIQFNCIDNNNLI